MADWKRRATLVRNTLIDGESELSADALAGVVHEISERLSQAAWDNRGEMGDLMFEAHLLLWAIGQATATDGLAEMQLTLKQHRMGGRPKSLQKEMIYGGAAARVERYVRSGMKQEAALAQVCQEFAGGGLSERTIERKLAELRAKTVKVSAPTS